MDSSRVRIPGGRIVLGTDLDGIVAATEQCSSDSKTACTVEQFADELAADHPTVVRSFWIDVQEVSTRDYDRCVRAGSCTPAAYPPGSLDWNRPEFPVVYVTHAQAEGYCRQRGGRLPTEAEWEWAASGGSERTYAWGHAFHGSRLNFGRDVPPYSDSSDGAELLAPVDAYFDGRTPQGVLQLCGNASEWTTSAYRAHDAPAAEGPPREFVIKGGSFRDAPVHQRVSARRPQAGSLATVDVGFRCVYDHP